METIVKKFGGTSVATVPHIRRVAERAVRAQLAGQNVVVVVSAMSGETNRLLELAYAAASVPPAQELDALAATGEQVVAALTAIAIEAAGGKAASLMSHQVPIVTDRNFSDARIEKIETHKLRALLERNVIPVVAGFQGVTSDGRISTLGRGGSDTTAVALAAALEASACEIFTDVDGVYTADPNVCPEAQKAPELSYQHMIALAAHGAKILHPRCVVIAEKFHVPLHVRSSFHDEPGTWITACHGLEQSRTLTIACDSQFAILKFDAAVSVVGRLLQRKIPVEFCRDGEIAVRKSDVKRAVAALGLPVAVEANLAKVSVVGQFFSADIQADLYAWLQAAKIAVYGFSGSALSLSILVPVNEKERVMRIFHQGLELGNSFQGDTK